MPTQGQLIGRGRDDLAALVDEYGGYDDVSRRLGMELPWRDNAGEDEKGWVFGRVDNVVVVDDDDDDDDHDDYDDALDLLAHPDVLDDDDLVPATRTSPAPTFPDKRLIRNDIFGELNEVVDGPGNSAGQES